MSDDKNFAVNILPILLPDRNFSKKGDILLGVRVSCDFLDDYVFIAIRWFHTPLPFLARTFITILLRKHLPSLKVSCYKNSTEVYFKLNEYKLHIICSSLILLAEIIHGLVETGLVSEHFPFSSIKGKNKWDTSLHEHIYTTVVFNRFLNADIQGSHVTLKSVIFRKVEFRRLKKVEVKLSK